MHVHIILLEMICDDTSGVWPGIVMLLHRDSVVSLLCCLSGTTTLGMIFDIPGLSVPGHQPGNR